MATPGKRLPPNNTKTMAKIIVNSQAPMPNMIRTPHDFNQFEPTRFLQKENNNHKNSGFKGFTVRSARDLAAELFKAVNIETARLDAELLLGHVLNKDRLKVLLDDEPLHPNQSTHFFQKVSRRLCHEPIAYILGVKEFFGHEFFVSKDCLIPRPDTEVVVEKCLELIDNNSRDVIVDLCTGSGAIAIALLCERPFINVLGSDISEAALKIAEKNAARMNVGERITLLQGDLLAPIPKDKSIKLIVSNPPYIKTKEMDNLPTSVRDFEPKIALYGGDDAGLSFYRRIIRDASSIIAKGAYLVLEIGFDQALDIKKLCEEEDWVFLETFKDLAGYDRGIVLQKR